jgi:hypothetical protein
MCTSTAVVPRTIHISVLIVVPLFITPILALYVLVAPEKFVVTVDNRDVQTVVDELKIANMLCRNGVVQTKIRELGYDNGEEDLKDT